MDSEPGAVAVFKNINGVEGHVFFFDTNGKTHLKAIFTALPSGKHGFHMHTAGDLRGDGCKGACDHFHVGAPRSHAGPGNGHTGDFGNIEITTQGEPAVYEFDIDVPITEVYGRSMIVHEGEDDLGNGGHEDSKTTGNSGSRIACAIIGRVGECSTKNMKGGFLTSPKDSKAMVIVEPRAHKNLQRVLENFNKEMKPEWDLYVFHGKSHGEFAKNAVQNIKERKVFVMPLHTDNLNAGEYSKLLQNKNFWDKVNAENILVFQTDTALCGKSKRKMNNFIKYNYIGCNIGTSIGDKVWGENHRRYGVGGLSFRKKSFMLKCIKNQTRKNNAENVAFSNCVHNSHRKPTSLKNAKNFCSQGIPTESAGSHKVNHMMTKNNKKIFYSHCPEAKAISNVPDNAHL